MNYNDHRHPNPKETYQAVMLSVEDVSTLSLGEPALSHTHYLYSHTAALGFAAFADSVYESLTVKHQSDAHSHTLTVFTRTSNHI